MNLISTITCLALVMNALHGFGREGVRYKTVKAGGLNIFYRETGPTNGPVILLLHGVPTSSRLYQPILLGSMFSMQAISPWTSKRPGHSLDARLHAAAIRALIERAFE